MPTIHYILPDGSTRSISAKPGSSVMETAIHNNVRGIAAECGGSCSCATCHVYVDHAFVERLTPPHEMEDDLLNSLAAARQGNSRLSCQIIIDQRHDGMTVRLPSTQG